MDQLLLVSNHAVYTTTANTCTNTQCASPPDCPCPPSTFPSEGDFSPPSPDSDMQSCPFLSLCTGGGSRLSRLSRHRTTQKTNKKHLRFSFFRRGRNFLKKSDSSGGGLEKKDVDVNEAVTDADCQDSLHSDVDTVGTGQCQCRKCSLISLGDVDTREVHSMIKFIKQNKVE